MNTSRKLLSGSILRLITLAIGVLLSFFMMPFIIHTVGDYWYGIWVVAASILSFYGLMDFGLSSATQRYIAHALARENREELNTVFMTSLMLFSGIGIIALLVTLAIAAAAPFFVEAKETLTTFRLLILILGTTFALSFPFHVLNGILSANLRYDISSYIQIGKMLVRTAFVIYALKSGYSILGMAVATIIVDISGHIVLLLICRKLAPWLDLRLKYFSKLHIGKLFNFGVFSFLIFLVEKFRLNIGSLIIAAYISVESVTIYNIAVQLSLHYIQVMASILAVIAPLFTRFASLGDDEKLRRSYFLVTRVGIIIAALLALGVSVFGRDFIRLWLGQEYLSAVIPLQILMIGLLFDVIQGPALSLFYAKAKHKFYAYLSLCEFIFSMVLTLALIPKFGLLGGAAGVAIPVFIGKFVIQPVYISKVIDINLYQYYKNIIPPLFLTVLVQIPVYWMMENTLNSYFDIALWGCLIYVPLAIFCLLVFLKKSEVSFLMGKISQALGR